MPPSRCDHSGAEREIGDELTIHHVPLDQIDTGSLQCFHLFAETAEIDGEDARSDLDRTAERGFGHQRGHDREGTPRTLASMSRPGRSSPSVAQRVRIERLVAGGDGLARGADGRVVFVAGGLPGELIDVRLISSKRDFARAEVVGVVEPSAARRQPPCVALSNGCGGCDWQHADGPAQLEWKAEIVREALRRTGRFEEADVRIGASVPEWGYRTSMRFSVDPSGRASLRRARSHDDIPISHCHVAHEKLSTLLEHVIVPGVDDLSLRVSVATGEATAWWEPAGRPPLRIPEAVAVGVNASLVERVGDVSFRVSAPSFFQSGPAAAEVLVRTVQEVGGPLLAQAGHVVDAYGGVGLFAATVAPAATRLTLVEGSESASADARVNLRDRDATIVTQPVEEWAARQSPALGADAIVADPSRQGLGSEAAVALAALGAPMIVLVSCDPVALARDARLLCEAGYRFDHTTVLDLFPQTHHVEAVSRFVRFI